MEEPDQESVEEPTRSEQDAREADAFMVKEWAGIAIVSIGAMVLLALVLMGSTGLADFPGPAPSVQWLVIAVVALALLAALGWSRRGL